MVMRIFASARNRRKRNREQKLQAKTPRGRFAYTLLSPAYYYARLYLGFFAAFLRRVAAASFAARRDSFLMDVGLMIHCALPGRPSCLCFFPESRPMLINRQTSALVVFRMMAAC